MPPANPHNIGFGVDNWVFEFAQYESSKRAIGAFVADLAARGLLEAERDILLVGRDDGFNAVCHLEAGGNSLIQSHGEGSA